MPSLYIQRSIGLSLFDLDADQSEMTDVAAEHPDVVGRLETLAEMARIELGDSATEKTGRGVREPGRVPMGLPAVDPEIDKRERTFYKGRHRAVTLMSLNRRHAKRQ